MAKTRMHYETYRVLYAAYEGKGEWVPVPAGVSDELLVQMARDHWLGVAINKEMMRITGRGLVAVRTAQIDRRTIPADKREQVMAEAEEVMDAPAELYDQVESIRGEDVGCGCEAAVLLARLKAFDPRIEKLVDAWAASLQAEKEWGR